MDFSNPIFRFAKVHFFFYYDKLIFTYIPQKNNIGDYLFTRCCKVTIMKKWFLVSNNYSTHDCLLQYFPFFSLAVAAFQSILSQNSFTYSARRFCLSR